MLCVHQTTLCMHSATYPVVFLAKREQPDRKELDSLSSAHGFGQHSPHLSLILVITMKSGMQTFYFSDHSLLFSRLTGYHQPGGVGGGVLWLARSWLVNEPRNAKGIKGEMSVLLRYTCSCL